MLDFLGWKGGATNISVRTIAQSSSLIHAQYGLAH